MTAYLARDLSQVGQNLDQTERITVEVVALDRTMGMILSGEIQDGKTIAVLLYCRAFMEAAS